METVAKPRGLLIFAFGAWSRKIQAVLVLASGIWLRGSRMCSPVLGILIACRFRLHKTGKLQSLERQQGFGPKLAPN